MKYKQDILRGILSGIIAGVAFQACSVMILFDFLSYVSFFLSFILVAVIAFFAFRKQDAKSFCLSVFISAIIYIVTLIALSFFNIDITVFRYIHGADAEMWAGDGFGFILLLIINFWGSIFGIILAIVYTYIWQQKIR